MRGLGVGGHGEGVEGMRGGWKLGEVWEKGGSRAKVWKRGKGFSKRVAGLGISQARLRRAKLFHINTRSEAKVKFESTKTRSKFRKFAKK